MFVYTSEQIDFNLLKKLSKTLLKLIFEVAFVDSDLTSMNNPATNIQLIWSNKTNGISSYRD